MVRQASTASREIQETYVASCSAEMSFGSAGTGEIYIYMNVCVVVRQMAGTPLISNYANTLVSYREFYSGR